jgi:hypothetical protein
MGINGPSPITSATLITGPDNFQYPRFGNASINNFAVSGDTFPNGYSSGFTFVQVVRPTGALGTMVEKTRGITTTVDMEMVLYNGPILAAANRASGDFVAKAAQQQTNTVYNTWTIIESYFPPGDSTPIIYKDGIQVTGSDLVNTNNAARGNNGSGMIMVGGNGNTPSEVDGYYAMTLVHLGALTPTQRANYRSAGITEGWIAATEFITVPATASGGVQSVNTYNLVEARVDGVCYYYTGAWTDADTVGGSLTPGHGGGIQWDLGDGAGWVHIEPDGGPYSVSQFTYRFQFNAGGRVIRMRMGDSAHADNSGQFNVQLKALT